MHIFLSVWQIFTDNTKAQHVLKEYGAIFRGFLRTEKPARMYTKLNEFTWNWNDFTSTRIRKRHMRRARNQSADPWMRRKSAMLTDCWITNKFVIKRVCTYLVMWIRKVWLTNVTLFFVVSVNSFPHIFCARMHVHTPLIHFLVCKHSKIKLSTWTNFKSMYPSWPILAVNWSRFIWNNVHG